LKFYFLLFKIYQFFIYHYKIPKQTAHSTQHNLIKLLSLIVFLPLLIFTSCQKTDLPTTETQHATAIGQVDPVQFTEMLQRQLSGVLSTRGATTYTMPDAINNIETFFSYHYGDYDVQTSDKYDYTDTITVSFASLPMSETEVAAFTEQVRLKGADQMTRITGAAQKYFYLISLRPVTTSTSSAQIEVHSYFGKNSVSWVDPNPNPNPTFSTPIDLDSDNRGSCADPNNNAINGAPVQLGYDIKAVLPAVYPSGIAWYQKLYFTNQMTYFATSAPNVDWNNYLDVQFKITNPNDVIPYDGVEDYLVYKRAGNHPNDPHYSCPYTCITNERYAYYGHNIYKALLDTRDYYGRNFINTFSMICQIEDFTEDRYWRGYVIFSKYYFSDTRSKVPFPTKVIL